MPDDTDITQYEDDADALQSHLERLAQVATLSMLVVAAVKRSDKKDQILDLFQRAVADAAQEIRQENKHFLARSLMPLNLTLKSCYQASNKRVHGISFKS